MQTQQKTKSNSKETAIDSPVTVCFVCTGNTCRSPMAQALVNDMTRTPPVCSMSDIENILNKKNIRATSAGLCAGGAPISKYALEALEKAGIRSLPDNDYKTHISRGIDIETVQTCDLIIGMTCAHAMNLIAAFPAYASKISCMPTDIPDPYGGNATDYQACLAEIKKGIKQLFFREDME